MADKDGTATAADNAGQDQGDATSRERTAETESYTKHRIHRALEKERPKIEAAGRKALLAELGLDPDDDGALDTLKAVVAKGSTADSERSKLQKQIEKLAAERDEHAKALSEYKRAVERRTVNDTIVESIGDAAIVPGTLPQIQRLLGDHLAVHEGKVVVVDDAGEPLPTAPKKFVTDWLAKQTHFLTATAAKGGAGSRAAGSTAGNGSARPPRTDEERKAFFEQCLRDGPPRG